MTSRSLFLLFNFLVLLTGYTSVCDDIRSPVVSQAIKDLQTFFDEHKMVGAKVITEFQSITVPKLQEGDSFNSRTIAFIFRAAFVRHITRYQIEVTPQLCLANFPLLHDWINGQFPHDLAPWRQFIDDIGLLRGGRPDNRTVRVSFKKVRKATQSAYLKNREQVRLFCNALVASNTLLDFETQKKWTDSKKKG